MDNTNNFLETNDKKPIISTSLKTRIRELEYNPVSIQRVVLEALREYHDKKVEIVDTETPFGFLLNTAAITVSAFIDEAEALTRKQYAISAQTEDDLYLHMSDKDYINRFAKPGRVKEVIFAFEKDELLQKLVYDDVLEIRKLIIPRNTEVKVNGLVFTLQYPIEIRQLQHGGIQIVYDTNIPTPIQVLETNIIDYTVINIENVDWLTFRIEMLQLSISTLYSDTNLLSNIEEEILFTDRYHYLRAYMQRGDEWIELYTTHTDQIYDISKLTVVLKVYKDSVKVTIPQIYSTAGMLTGRLRFDLYETKGDINTDLSIYPDNQFEVTWVVDKFNVKDIKYSTPLKQFKTLSVFSRSTVVDGSNEVPFEQLRQTVINHSVGAQVLPITPIQAETALTRAGYSIVKNIDNITNRVFLATRQLPSPKNIKLITPASASIESVIITENEAKALQSVKSNFRSLTITPDTIFENKKGVIKLVSTAKVNAILSLVPELRAQEVTKNNYFYTPFHYVLDFGLNEFSSRPYYLDKPEVLHKTFISDNDSTLLQVSINEFEIKRVDEGYQLIISVKSSDNYKTIPDDEVFVQLAYKPTNESNYAYLQGNLVGFNDEDERIFSFDLFTNFKVNLDDELEMTHFKMFTVDDKLLPTKLENDFQVLFSTATLQPAVWKPDLVDAKLGKFLLPEHVRGIANEEIRIRFGYSLKNLWARARSIVSASDYKRYTTDIPLTYQEDVYEVHEDGLSAVTIENGKVKYTIKHHKGDNVLDSKGNQVLAHKKGDIILKNGKPDFNDEYGLIRQLDVLLIEGAYWFATDNVTKEYKQEIVDTFVSWIVDGLGKISRNLLEQTKIYFYPKSTTGQIDVMVNNSIATIIDSSQVFKVELFVSGVVHSNLELRKELQYATIKILSEELKKDIVNNSNITYRLKEAYGSDVIAFNLEGLGGSNRIETITILNDAKRCSIHKRLSALGDGSLVVEEDVIFDFIRHDKKDIVS